MSASLITLIAESALALYPILIKNVPANLTTQLIARLGTYGSLAYILSSSDEKSVLTEGSTILYNVLNLIHISVSYASYTLLPAGNALALFYTFPFWTILAGWLFLGETLRWPIILLTIIAFFGVYLVAQNSSVEGFKEGETEPKKETSWIGVGLALASAFTETLIYLVAKTPSNPSPFSTILQLYPFAALGTIGYGLYEKNIDTDIGKVWVPLILFNAVVGFIGYSLRFWAIPKLSASVFSLLSFIGVSAAYGWQLLFTDEKINSKALLGASLITGSVAGLNYI